MTKTGSLMFGLIAFCLSSSVSLADELNVLSVASLKSAFRTIQPIFERQSGDKLVITFGNPGTTVGRFRDGAAADVLFVTDAVSKEAEAVGGLDLSSRRLIAATSLGVGIKHGAPGRHLAPPAEVLEVLAGAASIGIGEPGGVAYVKIFLEQLKKLGRYDMVAPKLGFFRSGELTAEAVGRGDVDLGVTTVPELIGVEGVDMLGEVPQDVIPYTSVVVGYTHIGSSEAARHLMDFLASPDGAAAIRATGLRPGG